MSRLDKYADWLINNEDKAGTPDFETVAGAYRELRAEASGKNPDQSALADELFKQQEVPEEVIDPDLATPDPEPVIATPDPDPVIATPDPVETVSPAPVGTDSAQVAADIRNILTEVPTAVESVDDSSGLSDDLKQRIAELDYLRECCGNWVGTRRVGKSNFLTAWQNKNVSVDSNVNYEDTLNQLEKLPELVRLWVVERKIKSDSNYFKNIESHTLSKPLFNEKSLTEKVEVVEQLVDLLTKCANGKISSASIKGFIDNLY